MVQAVVGANWGDEGKGKITDMLAEEADMMVRDYARRMQSQGFSIEQYMQITGMTTEKLAEEFKPQAEKRIQTRLVLEAVVKAENIVASDETVEAEFKRFSNMNKGIIDLIPAAVEAVKQETVKKMKLFSSDGKADCRLGGAGMSADDMEKLTKLVAAEVAKYLSK